MGGGDCVSSDGDGEVSAGKLHLPLPPSVNEIYANVSGKGRVKTKRYQSWLRAAGNEAMTQPRFRVEGAYILDITVCRGNLRRDLDNCAKAVSDALVAWEYVEDDRHMAELHVRWGAVQGCLVKVWPIESPSIAPVG